MKIHFLSFASYSYRNSLCRIKKQAIESGFFDNINCIRAIDLPFIYRISNLLILNRHKRGFGYWMWKSFITKMELEKMDNGDILVYADAGCVINKNGYKRFEEYIEMLSNSPISNLSFQSPHLEKEYVKGDVFKYFNLEKNDLLKNSGQLIAGVYLIRKDLSSINLIDTWYKICHSNQDLITDKKSKYPNDFDFIDHRHDQSIFSILRKIYGSIILPNETYHTNWDDNLHIPIHARRLN